MLATDASGTHLFIPRSTRSSSSISPIPSSPQSPLSNSANVAETPLAILGNSRSVCCALPARSSNCPANALLIKGVPNIARPIASTTGTKAPTPNPEPPQDSGKAIPAQPSDTISSQSAWSKPQSESNWARTAVIGDLSRQNSLATSNNIACSSVKLRVVFPISDIVIPYFGKPSTCSAIIFAWTWLVPPPIVAEKLFK